MVSSNESALFDLKDLHKTLPAIIARKDIDKYLGGVISKGYLANLDSNGNGPPKVKIGRHVAYLRAPLIEWLAMRVNK